MVKLTAPCESKMKDAHTYKKEKYLNLIKELRDVGYRAVLMYVEVGARGFIGSPVLGRRRSNHSKFIMHHTRNKHTVTTFVSRTDHTFYSSRT